MSQFNNIKITPNVGVNSNPKMEFTGAGNSTITLQVSSASTGGLLFYGANGDMLSIVDAPETSPVFSVNDRFSVPTIEAYANGNVFLASYPSYQVGFGITGFSQSNYKVELSGGLKVDDISSGSGKFNANISRSAVASPTGVLNPVLSFPSTAGKRYIVHSISVANVGRRQPQGAGATVGISSTTGAVTNITIDGVGVGYTDGDVFVSMATTDSLGRIRGLVSLATTSFVGVGTTGDPAYAGITSAIGIVTSVSGGAVTGIALTYNGFGYTSAPVVTFQSPVGGGTTETGTAVLTLGEVTAAYLNVPGEGYTTPPSVSIASTTGVGASITADVDSDGKVIRLNLLSRGYGYSKNNALGNNEENEVYVSLPPLAKTEVGVDVMYRRAPVGLGTTTLDAYVAFDVPIPVGGVVEVLKQPAVLNPSDAIHIRGLDVNGSGLSNAVDVHIAYEEENTTAFIGVSTALGSTIGLGTNVSGTLLTGLANPVLLQSLRLTNTEFVGDYDTSVKFVSDRVTASVASTVSVGGTIFFISGGINTAVVTTNSVVSIGTFVDKAPIIGIGSTAVTIGAGRTNNVSIAAGTGVTFFVLGYDSVYLARNIMIPAYASVELFDNPKRLERYSSLVIDTDVVGIDTNIASTIDVDLSGKIIY